MKLSLRPFLITMKTFAVGCIMMGAMAAGNPVSTIEVPLASFNDSLSTTNLSRPVAISVDAYGHLYKGLQLDSLGLSQKVFEYALTGMAKLEKNGKLKQRVVSIVDFSQSSDKKRLYVIDLDGSTLLYNTYVSHGRNTGSKDAQFFSNKPGSNKSSLGFYITANTYNGANGYSLRLHGVEKGFNDQAFRRAIVIHGADYVSEKYISSQGYIGRSQGCPAIPSDISRDLINNIKDGTCLFVYHSAQQYPMRSALLR